jgi:hypothetical protein
MPRLIRRLCMVSCECNSCFSVGDFLLMVARFLPMASMLLTLAVEQLSLVVFPCVNSVVVKWPLRLCVVCCVVGLGRNLASSLFCFGDNSALQLNAPTGQFSQYGCGGSHCW